MLDHTQHAARLQGRIGVGEEFVGVAAAHPIVQIAEGQHDIGCAFFGQRAAFGGKGAVFNRTEFRVFIICLEFCEAFRDAGAAVFIAHIRIEIGGDQCAIPARQIRREDVGVPATARPQLNHFVIGLHAEEFQRFLWIAPGIAGLFLVAAMRASDGGLKRCGLCRGRLDRRCGRLRCFCCRGVRLATGGQNQRGQGENRGDWLHRVSPKQAS